VIVIGAIGGMISSGMIGLFVARWCWRLATSYLPPRSKAVKANRTHSLLKQHSLPAAIARQKTPAGSARCVTERTVRVSN